MLMEGDPSDWVFLINHSLCEGLADKGLGQQISLQGLELGGYFQGVLTALSRGKKSTIKRRVRTWNFIPEDGSGASVRSWSGLGVARSFAWD